MSFPLKDLVQELQDEIYKYISFDFLKHILLKNNLQTSKKIVETGEHSARIYIKFGRGKNFCGDSGMVIYIYVVNIYILQQGASLRSTRRCEFFV